MAQAVDSSITPGDLRRHVSALSAIPSRVIGQPGAVEAAEYVRRELESMGAATITPSTFTVLAPVEYGSSLTFQTTGETIPIYPFWPNGVRTCTTPPAGLAGPLIYGGYGELHEYGLRNIQGAIVVLEFNSQEAWLKAGSLGASAILFLEPESAPREECESKFTTVPVSLPRYFIPRREGDRLRDLCRSAKEPLLGRIDSLVRWENVKAVNYIAAIPGTDPGLKHEAVFLSAYYDAMSVVPSIAPGAEQSSSMAALLEIGRRFAQNPPRRTVLLLAVSAHFYSLTGIVDFISRGKYSPERSLIWPDLGLDYKNWFFIGLDLTTHGIDLGLDTPIQQNYYDVGRDEAPRRVLQPWARGVTALLVDEGVKQLPPVRIFDGISRIRGLDLGPLTPGQVALDAEAVALRGEAPVYFLTVEDRRDWFDSPHDTLGRMNLNNLASQTNVIAALVRQAVNAEKLPEKVSPRPADRMAQLNGQTLLARQGGAWASDLPLPGAIVTILFKNSKTWRGVRLERSVLADSEGRFVSPGYEIGPEWARDFVLRLGAYYIDPRTGEILYAPELGGNQSESSLSVQVRSLKQQARLTLFPCMSFPVFDLLSPKDFRILENLRVLDAGSNVEPLSYGLFQSWKGPRSEADYAREPLSLVFVKEDAPFKVHAWNLFGDPTLLLANTRRDDPNLETSLGTGFRPERGLELPFTALSSARDMAAIATARLKTFAKHGIHSDYLVESFAKVDEILARAESARQRNDLRDFRAESREAWALAAKNYPGVKRTADDMIAAVMFYMALLVPFALFMERLVIGSVEVQKRLAWSAGIFAAVFLVFRFVHPAFDLSFTPALILLSFVIFVLSVSVSAVVLARFEEEFRRMREELGEAHQADVGRVGASLGAFGLGVSHLRNRPARTFLTCLTLILLTFTLLSFTSIQSYLGYNKRQREGGAPYNGFMISDPAGWRLVPGVLDDVRERFPHQPVSARVWSFPNLMPQVWGRWTYELKCSLPDREPKTVRALLRLDPVEDQVTGISRFITSGRWFRTDEQDVCLIPATLADAWNISDPIKESASLRWQSVDYRIVGVFDDRAFKSFTDLDGYPLMPIDFYTQSRSLTLIRDQSSNEQTDLSESLDQSDVPRISADEIIILSGRRSTGPHVPIVTQVTYPDDYLASVAVAFPDAKSGEEAVREFAAQSSRILFAGVDGERYEYSSRRGTSIQGLSALIVPLLISALIVFNTMLGAVHERRPEISVYNAMGLSPTHIGFLFLGEACVYANVSAVLGYLVGQGAGQIISALHLLPGLTLNYSALAAVWTSAMIGVVVIVSALYPAAIGARMAVPSTDRRWRLPEPAGDRMDIDLPFTVAANEAPALGAYLEEFFDAHVEYVMGNFYADDVRLEKQEGRNVLSARLWLAPYDLGVSQAVEIVMSESAVEGFCGVDMSIHRLEGDVASWRRTNQILMKSLRKQFLLWRTLSPAQKDQYQERARGKQKF